jgi:hypothetical protein
MQGVLALLVMTRSAAAAAAAAAVNLATALCAPQMLECPVMTATTVPPSPVSLAVTCSALRFGLVVWLLDVRTCRLSL